MGSPIRLNLVFATLVAAAFALPRLLARDQGLAGSTTAAVTGLGLLLAAAVVALIQLVATLKAWHTASSLDRALGLLPLLVLLVTGTLVAVALP